MEPAFTSHDLDLCRPHAAGQKQVQCPAWPPMQAAEGADITGIEMRHKQPADREVLRPVELEVQPIAIDQCKKAVDAGIGRERYVRLDQRGRESPAKIPSPGIVRPGRDVPGHTHAVAPAAFLHVVLADQFHWGGIA